MIDSHTSKRPLYILLSGIAALALLGGGYYFISSSKAADTKTSESEASKKSEDAAEVKKQKDEAPDVSFIVPARTAVQTQVTITGTLAARQELPVSAEGEGGRISAIYANIGDRVNAGTVLARLTTDMMIPQMEQLKASLEEARANAELAKADYNRAQSVADTGAISREELDRRKATAATAAARAKVVAAQLAEAKVRMSRAEIRAPASGTVLMRTAELGQIASQAGAPLFQIARDGEVELRAQIAEQDLPKVRVGQEVAVRLTGVSEVFIGKVWQLGAVIDSRTRQGTVRIDLPRSPTLRSGAFAQGTIEAGGSVSPVLPQSAIQSDAKGNYVFIIDSNNKVVKRDIQVGATSASGVTISAGLAGTEKVVATSAAFLREGEIVKPVLRKA
jgi:HlyD family secretion protein